jgi:hypothetical protein
MELRDYQIENANTLSEIIKCFNIAVFCAEMRTGKTLTALQTAKILNKKYEESLKDYELFEAVQKLWTAEHSGDKPKQFSYTLTHKKIFKN